MEKLRKTKKVLVGDWEYTLIRVLREDRNSNRIAMPSFMGHQNFALKSIRRIKELL